MDNWKTYSLSLVIIIGTLILIAIKVLPPDAWWQGCTVAGGMYVTRTVTEKITKARNGG